MNKAGKINSIVSIMLVIGLLLQIMQPALAMAVPEKNVALPGQDGYVHLTQYTQHVEDNIFKVSMSMKPIIQSNGGDFVILIDANENMLKQSVDGKTYFQHALDSAYSASRILLDPEYNPLAEIGVNQNRVWLIFYNGQAYNTDGTPLVTGTTSKAFCYISDDMYKSPTARKYPGVAPPESQMQPFGNMISLINQFKANPAPFSAQTGLFNSDVQADQQRYTAVGLAAAYDVFADFSGKGGNETNRKVVMLLSNGPDYERDDVMATNSGNVPTEGSMRMEAQFVAKALKFQSHAYNSASTDKAFGVTVEGDLKTAAQSIASSSGNTYFKDLPVQNWKPGMPQYIPYGNGLPLPVDAPISESVISLDAHKVTIGHDEGQMNPFALIHYKGLASWTDPFQVNNGTVDPVPQTVPDTNPVTPGDYQYRMFGLQPLVNTSKERLSPLNARPTPSGQAAANGRRDPIGGYLTQHGRGDDKTAFVPDWANTYSALSKKYTYADNKMPLKETYKKIASKGGMSAEIWSVGLFVGDESDTVNPGLNVAEAPYGQPSSPSDGVLRMVSDANGWGVQDGFDAKRWKQGAPYRSDFTGYTEPEHVLRVGNTFANAGWRPFDLLNTNFIQGTGLPRGYSISYIPQPGASGSGTSITPGGAMGSYATPAGAPYTQGSQTAYVSPNINGPTSIDYKVDVATGQNNAKWFDTMSFGGPRANYPTVNYPNVTIQSSGGPSTQTNDTQHERNAPEPLGHDPKDWKSNHASIPSAIRINAQEVPYYNGVDFAQRDKLYQHLKALSTVQTSVLKDGAGFDPKKPWVNNSQIWTARQGYLTTSQLKELDLIVEAQVNNAGVATVQSYGGENSFNQDYQNYYEAFQVVLRATGYYNAMNQILSTDRQTHPLSQQTAAYDKEDFEPIVRMVKGPSLMASDEEGPYDVLVRTFEDLVYDYYKISYNSFAKAQLSEYFNIVSYERDKEDIVIRYGIPDEFPQRLTKNLSSVSHSGQDIEWKFDKTMYSGLVYELVFYVELNEAKANNPDMNYPLQNYAYINLNLKTLTRDANDNLIRIQTIKNFPANYVQPKNKQTPYTITETNEIITEEGRIIGVFPSGANINSPFELNNLALPFYTPSVTPAPKKQLKDEKVDDATEDTEVPATGMLGMTALVVVSGLFVVAVFVKRRSNIRK